MFFRRYFDFEGRSTRSEYWWVQFFIWLVILGLAILGGLMNGGNIEGIFESDASPMSSIFILLIVAFFLAIIIPNLALSVRRFHDLNQTGWLVLVFGVGSALPLVGFFVSIGEIIWFCFRGTVGPNNYGNDPLQDPGELGIFD